MKVDTFNFNQAFRQDFEYFLSLPHPLAEQLCDLVEGEAGAGQPGEEGEEEAAGGRCVHGSGQGGSVSVWVTSNAGNKRPFAKIEVSQSRRWPITGQPG